MNPIKHLKDSGKGKRVFLVGNGPSIADMDLDLLKDEDTIAMNRIDLIYPKTEWRPTYYIFCSDNCRNNKWGNEWSKSVVKAAKQDGTTPLIWNRYRGEIEKRGGKLPKNTIFLSSMSENKVGSPQAFSTDAEKRLDKSGTTMNVALQLAYYMGYSEVYIVGCDSNWKTATNTKKGGDPNHFDKGYHAHIGNGRNEFNRMNGTHVRANKAFESAGKKIFNVGYNSAINAYPKGEFDEVIRRNKPRLCCGNLMWYWFDGKPKTTDHSEFDWEAPELAATCNTCGKIHYLYK